MHWFGPLPGTREARAFSWMAIAVALIVCTLSIARGFQGETFLGRPLGGDFVQFYAAGKILNHYPPRQIYDLDLEVKLQHQAAPGTDKDQMLVFASAPYLALIFRPFARLPYAWAYLAWLIFSLVLYATGMHLLLSSTALPAGQRRTGFLLGISCMPFLMESWIGGQVSILGFFALALFLFLRARNQKFLAGLALSLALFKPTLIAIPFLMLLVGRRWRMLGGVFTGAATLTVASLAAVGPQGCVAWIATLQFYGRIAAGSAAALRRYKYVDIGSFFHLLLGNSSAIASVLGAGVAMAGIAILAAAWWRSSAWEAESRDLLWAATLAGALVSNVYTPIYDTVLAVPAAVLAAGVMLRRSGRGRERFSGWMVLLYMVPWVTQSLAEFLRFQPFTLALGGFAWWLLELAQRPADQAPRVEAMASAAQDAVAVGGEHFTSTRHFLGVTSYPASSGTRKSGTWLSVLLRSYSPFPALSWGRDR